MPFANILIPLALDGTAHDAIDEVFLQDDENDDDGNNGHKGTAEQHVIAHLKFTDEREYLDIDGFWVVGRHYHHRHEEIVPDSHTLENQHTGSARFEKRKHDTPKSGKGRTAIDGSALFYFLGYSLDKRTIEQGSETRSSCDIDEYGGKHGSEKAKESQFLEQGNHVGLEGDHHAADEEGIEESLELASSPFDDIRTHGDEGYHKDTGRDGKNQAIECCLGNAGLVPKVGKIAEIQLFGYSDGILEYFPVGLESRNQGEEYREEEKKGEYKRDDQDDNVACFPLFLLGKGCFIVHATPPLRNVG